jgi:nitroreductase
MSTFDLAQVDRLLMTTRAVRKRLDLDRPVEPEVITECLQLATYSPNAANTQLWRWLVVTDADKREQVAAVYRGLFNRYVRAAASEPDGASSVDYAQDPATARMVSASAYLADNLHRVPVHVIPCYLERPVPESGNVGLATLYGSIVQAVWSFQLALRSRGLGSVWTTMHLRSEQEVAALLGIPDDVTQVALIPVAYTIGDDFKPPPRRPAEEVTYWNDWGATQA